MSVIRTLVPYVNTPVADVLVRKPVQKVIGGRNFIADMHDTLDGDTP